MLKTPTSAIIAIIVVAFIVATLYIFSYKPKPIEPVVDTVQEVVPVDNSVETVVTPVTETVPPVVAE